MKYGKYTLGQIEAIFNMIGGETAVDSVLAGERKINLAYFEPAISSDQPKKFVATVVYTCIPLMDELRRRFPAFVDQAFSDIVFKPIKVCKKISRETREVEFEYVHLDHGASNDEVLAKIERHGLRPALPEELFAFDAKYPEEMTKFRIVALGSETKAYPQQVVYLLHDDRGRKLNLHPIALGWDDRCWFLCVRKEKKLPA